MNVTATSPAADLTVVEQALRKAASAEGFDPAGAVLLSAGRTHVFRLPRAVWKGSTGVVVKVHRKGSSRAAAQHCAIAYWARSEGVLTPRPLRRQPVPAHGHPVSFWEDLGDGQPASPEQLADVLNDLHSLPVPPPFLGVPVYQPLTDLHVRVRTLPRTLVKPAIQSHLLHELGILGHWWNEVRWPTRPGVIHAGLSPREIRAGTSGPAVLDLADLAVGQPMVDLTAVAVQHELYTEDDPFSDVQDEAEAAYQAFCRAYGVDVTSYAGGRPHRMLRWLHVLDGCIAAFERAATAETWKVEADYRLSCVQGQEGSFPWHWRTLTEMVGAAR
ncbi:phosphotransferase [Kitasatospora sp. NPDC088548]|uniref:phosphotransferase n=1 Tax=Kitasatospora sp. NPDC088548 TaxID=3364075 RepID=UPI003812BDE9